MNDSDDPKDPKIEDLEGLEKHIKMSWEEDQKTSTQIDPPSEDRPSEEKPAEVVPTPEESHLPREETVPMPERPSKPEAEIGIVLQYYRDLIQVLTEPTAFFRDRYPKTRLSYALAFGIVTLWISSFLEWITRMVRHETLLEGFTHMRNKLQELPFWKSLPENFWSQGQDSSQGGFPSWILEVARLAFSPFQSLVHLCIQGFALFIGAWLLIRTREDGKQDSVSIGNFIRIASFAAAPFLISAFLGFLPLGLGGFIGWVYSIVLLVMALGARYQASALRSIVVMILPAFLFGALMMAFILAMFILGAALIATVFH